MLTVWQNDGVEQQRKALARNIPVIMCPKDPCYYDFGYARNPLRKVYEWEPVDDWIAPEKRHLIKGGQVCLWTEFVTTLEDVERMFYPRLCALSEVLWCRPNKKDWDNFAVRMQNMYPQLKTVGIHFYEGDTLGGEWFKAKNSYPELVMPARIETNIRAIQYYDPEYAFDGKYETFFASSFATGKENYFLLELDKSQKVSHIHVICDESKEYLDAADLLISRDGLTFVKVADFDCEGADAHFEEVEVKAVKIQMTGKNFRRLVIREIEIE